MGAGRNVSAPVARLAASELGEHIADERNDFFALSAILRMSLSCGSTLHFERLCN
jgi:hypothetical protein